MNPRITRALHLLLCLLILSPLCHAEALDYDLIGEMTVVHCESWVSLRAFPSSSAERVLAVPLGATVTAYEANDPQFCYCIYEGYEGYILREYLSPMGLDDAGGYARLWDAQTGSAIAQSVWASDRVSDRSEAVRGEIGSVSIGAYADWLLTYAPWGRDANGLMQALADDCAYTDAPYPEALRSGSVSLNASELYAWNDGGLRYEFYDFTLVNASEVYELLFFCYSETDGGELTEYTLVKE